MTIDPVSIAETRKTPLSRRYIPRSLDVVEWAPVRFVPVCLDRTGRARKAHDFDRDGVCTWCPEREKSA